MRTYALVFFCILLTFPLAGCHKKEIARMKEECARLEASGNATGSRVAALADEIRLLKTECEKLSKKIRGLEEGREDLDSKIGALSERIFKAELDMQIERAGKRVIPGYSPPDKRIDATVMETYPEYNLVMLSVGTDDGVKIGYKFYIYRENTYIGAMTIQKTWEDSCAGAMIPREGSYPLIVEKGDSATTHLAD